MTRPRGSTVEMFSVGGYIVMALCVMAFGWFAPALEKRGYASWAFVLRFFGIAGAILSCIVAGQP